MSVAPDQPTARAGVVGYPIKHSLSPVLHGHRLKRYGIKGRYDAVEISPDRFADDMRALLQQPDWRGCNVTVPHKEAAFRLVDHHDEAAQRLGAVNTIVKRDDGSLEGRNTDLYGFRRNLETAPGFDGVGRGRAVVIGAGGAARAVVAALQDLGFARIHLVNRTRAKADDLAASLGGAIDTAAMDDVAPLLPSADLLVNTTSLGMVAQPPLELPLAGLKPGAFVTDIVYNPLETDLIARARAAGHPSVDGLGMLLHQAVPGFVAWFNPPEVPPVDAALRDTVLKAMGQ
jgi:shikimate dehydrogenase